MIVAVPREVAQGERRVAVVPATVRSLADQGLEVVVERAAGDAAAFRDSDYTDNGARVEESTEALYASATVVLKVQPPGEHPTLGRHEADLIPEGAGLISFLWPFANQDLVRRLAERKVSSFAMDLMPRITRAQSMDALSSASSVAGYKAVLIAAGVLPRFFPMLMTAAGTITPARVLVLGAGVAGLQAVATARRLGAVVYGFDIRPSVKEQVESLGARFVDTDVDTGDAEEKTGYAREQTEETQARIRDQLAEHVKKADVVISTALVPGKAAPLLVTAATVAAMRPGSVIVDLAAEQGGNCEVTKAGEEVVHEGVTVCGPLNLPSTLPLHASEMYAKNVSLFLLHLIKEGNLHLDLEDELTKGPLVTHKGEVVHEAVRAALSPDSPSPEEANQ